MPTASCSTFATGARQFVVHDAFEMMWWLLGVVVALEVHAERNRHVGVGGRGRDDDLAGTRLEVLRGVLALGEQPGGLDRDLDAELAPRQGCRVALREDLDLVPVDHQRPVALRYLAREAAEDGVVLEEMGERSQVGDVVDRDDLDVRARSYAARNRLRPMRPKPLMPTLTGAMGSFLLCCFFVSGGVSGA